MKKIILASSVLLLAICINARPPQTKSKMPADTWHNNCYYSPIVNITYRKLAAMFCENFFITDLVKYYGYENLY